VSISLDDRLPAGPWTASITLESGLTKRTVEASITFPESGLAAPVAAEQGGESGPPLTLIVGAGVAGLSVLAATILLVSRRRRRASASPPGSRGGLVTPASTS
jgi:hypothetical protein